MKPPRAALLRSPLAALVPLALLGLALGVRAGIRERTLPGRELAALERARADARELALRPLPALDALAARAHEDALSPEALLLPGLADLAILSLDPKEPPVVWHRSPSPEPLTDLARGFRGESLLGELATLDLKDPPASFSKVWSLGIEHDQARAALLLGRRNGLRIVAVLIVTTAQVDGQ